MSDDATLSCPWCSAVAPAGSTSCPACGAALAQRESIGDLVIPGVTSIDPALADADGRPLRIAGPSPAQGAATGALAAVALGGPVGLAALGGMAAVGAAEYVAANRRGPDRPEDLDEVGRPSEVTLQALEQLERVGANEPTAAETDAPPDPWRDLPPEPAGHGNAAGPGPTARLSPDSVDQANGDLTSSAEAPPGPTATPSRS